MKEILFSFLLIIAAGGLQAQVREDKVEYSKEKQNCLTVTFKYPEEAVQNALIDKMKKMGNDGKEIKGLFSGDKGFRIYKGSVIPAISPNRYDYIVNIEKKSKKDDDATVMRF